MIESKAKRVLVALGLAFAPFILLVFVGMGFDLVDEGINTIGLGGLGAGVFGILDFFLYLLLDTEGDGGKIGATLKNIIFYAIMVVELVIGFSVCLDHSLSGGNILADIEKHGGVVGMAFMGFVGYSWIVKFFAYLFIRNGDFLQQEALPYVSAGSMVVGYLVAVVVLLIGTTSQFVVQWVPFILFMAGAITVVVFYFKNGFIFDGDGGSANRSYGSSSGSRSGSRSGSGARDLTKAGVWTKVSNAVFDYCQSITTRRYPNCSYIRYASLNISSSINSKQYIVEWSIDVTFYYSFKAKSESEAESKANRVRSEAQSFLSTVRGESKAHMKKIYDIVERIVRQEHPDYAGTYGVEPPEINGSFEEA